MKTAPMGQKHPVKVYFCDPGDSLAAATSLAQGLTQFPQLCLRSDRLSSYRQWGMDLDTALIEETRLGREVVSSGETRDGATRFAEGKGRHGDFDNI